MSYGKIGLTTVAVTQDLSGMPFVLKIKLIHLWYLNQDALSKLFTREGWAGADGAILSYVGHLQLI